MRRPTNWTLVPRHRLRRVPGHLKKLLSLGTRGAEFVQHRIKNLAGEVLVGVGRLPDVEGPPAVPLSRSLRVVDPTGWPLPLA